MDLILSISTDDLDILRCSLHGSRNRRAVGFSDGSNWVGTALVRMLLVAQGHGMGRGRDLLVAVHMGLSVVESAHGSLLEEDNHHSGEVGLAIAHDTHSRVEAVDRSR